MVLNEVVVAVRALARMGHFEIFYNEEHLTVVRGDGVIISTSTGSTAYNLAAGGPIVAPDVDAITLTPICSHQLNQRCLVVSPYAVLKIVLNSENSAFVSLDGQRGYAIERGDFIQIHRAKVPAQLFYQPTQSYFATLRSKLGWGKEYHPVSSSVVPGS
jgi:NAD+ kinase